MRIEKCKFHFANCGHEFEADMPVDCDVAIFVAALKVAADQQCVECLPDWGGPVMMGPAPVDAAEAIHDTEKPFDRQTHISGTGDGNPVAPWWVAEPFKPRTGRWRMRNGEVARVNRIFFDDPTLQWPMHGFSEKNLGGTISWTMEGLRLGPDTDEYDLIEYLGPLDPNNGQT